MGAAIFIGAPQKCKNTRKEETHIHFVLNDSTGTTTAALTHICEEMTAVHLNKHGEEAAG